MPLSPDHPMYELDRQFDTEHFPRLMRVAEKLGYSFMDDIVDPVVHFAKCKSFTEPLGETPMRSPRRLRMIGAGVALTGVLAFVGIWEINNQDSSVTGSPAQQQTVLEP